MAPGGGKKFDAWGWGGNKLNTWGLGGGQ